MTADERLKNLKVDLGITTAHYDERLEQYLETAKREIERQGAALDLNLIDHSTIVIMYAAWMWRRRDTGDGMPRMLRYEINNLVMSQKGAVP
jgi:hypothetical protein